MSDPTAPPESSPPSPSPEREPTAEQREAAQSFMLTIWKRDHVDGGPPMDAGDLAALLARREAPLHARIAELERERDAARASNALISCTYCGWTSSKGNVAGMLEHIQTCAERVDAYEQDMRRVEVERDAAIARAEKLEAEPHGQR